MRDLGFLYGHMPKIRASCSNAMPVPVSAARPLGQRNAQTPGLRYYMLILFGVD